MTSGFTESDAEEAALGWLETLGYAIRHGPEIAFDADGGERTDPGYRDTILQNRLYRENGSERARISNPHHPLGYPAAETDLRRAAGRGGRTARRRCGGLTRDGR